MNKITAEKTRDSYTSYRSPAHPFIRPQGTEVVRLHVCQQLFEAFAKIFFCRKNRSNGIHSHSAILRVRERGAKICVAGAEGNFQMVCHLYSNWVYKDKKVVGNFVAIVDPETGVWPSLYFVEQ